MTPRDGSRRQGRLFAISLAIALVASVIPLVSALAANTLAFSTEPGGAIIAGVPFPQQPIVHADNGGPVSGVAVTLSIRPGTGTAGASLSCTGGLSKTTNASGNAAFAGCKVDKSGQNYQLRAIATGYPNENSASFDVAVGPADHLAFNVYPASQTPSLLNPQPAVRVVDAGGNLVTTGSHAITVDMNKNNSATQFACTSAGNRTQNSAGGAVVYAGCTETVPDTGYHLTASSPGLAPAVGATFEVTSGPATTLLVCWGATLPCNTTPPTATGGAPFPTQPTVRVADASGNTVATDSTTVVTLAILAGTPTAGGPGTLTCTGGLARTVVRGVATYAGCAIDKAGVAYKLNATSAPALTAAVTNAFNVNLGPPTRLAFVVQPPTSATARVAFPGSIQVGITDAGGNVVSSGITATIGLSIGTNPSAGALSCPSNNTATTNNGIATFTGCSINNKGNGYTLVATAQSAAPVTTLAPATSTVINVLAPSAAITLTPSSTVITWGDDFTLQVHFGVNGAAKPFALQVSKDASTWSTIASLTTDANGNASFVYGPSDNRYYRVSFAGTGDLQAGTSPTVRVVVRQIAILRPPPTSGYQPIPHGTTILFETTIRPNRPELPQGVAHFVVYQRKSAGWITVLDRLVPVDRSDGVASLQVTFNTPGRFYFRSEAVPTPLNANSGWSPLDKFLVQ